MTKVEPIWIDVELATAIHDRQLSEHGGSSGTRDATMLESALARPQQMFAYGDPPPTVAEMAASLAFGLARNHPFVDGNKRTAFVCCLTFLFLNGGYQVTASPEERYATFLGLAAGEIAEKELAQWIAANASTDQSR